jgi:hypothetical protein
MKKSIKTNEKLVTEEYSVTALATAEECSVVQDRRFSHGGNK